MKYQVVIPYLASAADGREIEYAIEGWRRYFLEDHQIIVVGEGASQLANNKNIKHPDLVLIERERVPGRPGMYRQHLDYVACWRQVHRDYPADGFIFVADDVYAMNNFTITDVKVNKIQSMSFVGDMGSLNGWSVDKARTRRLLDKEGLPHRNFTTHLPIWFDWDKWEQIVDRYNMDEESYVVEDLYGNTFMTGDAVLLGGEGDFYRHPVWTTIYSPKELISKFDRKIWLVNSVSGWNLHLADFLRFKYGF